MVRPLLLVLRKQVDKTKQLPSLLRRANGAQAVAVGRVRPVRVPLTLGPPGGVPVRVPHRPRNAQLPRRPARTLLSLRTAPLTAPIIAVAPPFGQVPPQPRGPLIVVHVPKGISVALVGTVGPQVPTVPHAPLPPVGPQPAPNRRLRAVAVAVPRQPVRPPTRRKPARARPPVGATRAGAAGERQVATCLLPSPQVGPTPVTGTKARVPTSAVATPGTRQVRGSAPGAASETAANGLRSRVPVLRTHTTAAHATAAAEDGWLGAVPDVLAAILPLEVGPLRHTYAIAGVAAAGPFGVRTGPPFLAAGPLHPRAEAAAGLRLVRGLAQPPTLIQPFLLPPRHFSRRYRTALIRANRTPMNSIMCSRYYRC